MSAALIAAIVWGVLAVPTGYLLGRGLRRADSRKDLGTIPSGPAADARPETRERGERHASDGSRPAPSEDHAT
jgi:hypothetical protein